MLARATAHAAIVPSLTEPLCSHPRSRSLDAAMPTYADLGPYSDLVDACRALGPVFPETFVTTDEVRATLRFTVGDEQPGEATTADRWEADGVEGEEVTWSVGYGPPTRALLLKPAGAKGQLPGIVAFIAPHNAKPSCV